jgi:phosphoglycolate phosphatase
VLPEHLAAATAVMIGDRVSDVLAARANGARSIGVRWGYGSRAELAGAGADALCLTPRELRSCLSRIAS